MKLSTKIKLVLRSLVMNAGAIETDKAVLQYEGDELTVGKEVFIEVDGEVVPAEDGEYVAEGKTIVVAEGKVSEIREDEEPAAEETVVEVSASKQRFNALKAVYEASYEEKIEKIAEAIRALGMDAWVVEAADTYAVAEVWDDAKGDYKHIRFDVSWGEDGMATVSNPEEVKSEFVPVDETEEKPAEPQEFAEEPEPADEPETVVEGTKTTEEKVADLEEAIGDIRGGIEQITNAIAAVAKRLEVVEEKMNSLEEPAAEPAEEGEETEVKASRLSYLRK